MRSSSSKPVSGRLTCPDSPLAGIKINSLNLRCITASRVVTEFAIFRNTLHLHQFRPHPSVKPSHLCATLVSPLRKCLAGKTPHSHPTLTPPSISIAAAFRLFLHGSATPACLLHSGKAALRMASNPENILTGKSSCSPGAGEWFNSFSGRRSLARTEGRAGEAPPSSLVRGLDGGGFCLSSKSAFDDCRGRHLPPVEFAGFDPINGRLTPTVGLSILIP